MSVKTKNDWNNLLNTKFGGLSGWYGNVVVWVWVGGGGEW